MDDSGHRDNGRQKPGQGQWLMQHQPSMKQIMAIMAERDAAVQERNLALSEKKAALAERDVAILQRDSAIADRNNAIIERDNAIATLQYRETSLNAAAAPCPPGCQIGRTIKHIHHPHHLSETPYEASPEPAKPDRRAKRAGKLAALRSPKKVKLEVGDQGADRAHDWRGGGFEPGLKQEQQQWKEEDLGLNQVAFDETTMSVPVCSCTGVLRPCYKWGSGGWQSSCCTTSLSMYPLPAVPNKRHTRVGGRKMSGSAFNKLLSRLAAEGHDLLGPVDLKDHWAKHGTNRYITIK